MRSMSKMLALMLPLFFVFAVLLVLPAPSFAHPTHPARPAQIAVGISVGIAPPPIPYYDQPLCPGDGYIWTPGYWAYGDDGYFWVPGTWILAPFVGGLWTPGYWGWGGSAFMWHVGYWGPHIGFYGGVNYGFGYVGTGYFGGEWRGGVFAYNSSVNHIDVNVIHNTYNRTVVNVRPGGTSYNGGAGGIQRQPTAAETAAADERRAGPTDDQTQHEHVASADKGQLYSENHGRPTVAATTKPGDFSHGAVAAKGSPSYRPPAGTVSHAATTTEHATTHAADTTAHTTTHAANTTEHATTHAANTTAHATTHAANTTEHTTTHTATTTTHAATHTATHTAPPPHQSAPHDSAPHGGGGAGGGGHDDGPKH